MEKFILYYSVEKPGLVLNTTRKSIYLHVWCVRRKINWDITYKDLLPSIWGNNPFPLSSYGKCCDECMDTKVLPARAEYFISQGYTD